MTHTRNDALVGMLTELEAALRTARLWDAAPPEPEALESVEPFCVDTLSLPQWLQWIFLPRIRALLDARAALPERCGITPIAEICFMGRSDADARRLLAILADIDSLLAGDSPAEPGSPRH